MIGKLSAIDDMDFQALFEAMPGLFLVLKPDQPKYTIVAASDAFLKGSMTKRADILGRGLFEVFPDNPNDPKATGENNLGESLKRVIKSKAADKMPLQKYDIEKPASMGGGFDERYWSPLNSPVLDKDKNVIYIIQRVEDVTEVVMAERIAVAEKRTAQAEIDEKTLLINNNQERINEIMDTLLKYTILDFSQTIQISEKGDELDAIAVGLNTLSEELKNHIQQVESGSQRLEAVNKELEAFSYSVSHDLRAPLRAIDGYAKILEEDYHATLDPEAKRLLTVIQYNAKRMAALIDDLLAFSRLGKKEVQRSDINMKELVEGALFDISKSTDYRAEVKLGALHPLKADYSLINQVMINFISNAVKYSSKRAKPLVEIGSAINKDGEVVYSVIDNGVGFNMDYAHKMFGVFQRLHTLEEFEGTGVGLAIVQRVINKHGGKVWAESKIGEGAAFHFSIPNQ